MNTVNLPGYKKALPKRSRGVPVKLARKTCLRSSKRNFDDPTHRYGYKDFRKCDACARKHKGCDALSISPCHRIVAIANSSHRFLAVSFLKSTIY